MLYILTSVCVLPTPNTGRNILFLNKFLHFSCRGKEAAELVCIYLEPIPNLFLFVQMYVKLWTLAIPTLQVLESESCSERFELN